MAELAERRFVMQQGQPFRAQITAKYDDNTALPLENATGAGYLADSRDTSAGTLLETYKFGLTDGAAGIVEYSLTGAETEALSSSASYPDTTTLATDIGYNYWILNLNTASTAVNGGDQTTKYFQFSGDLTEIAKGGGDLVITGSTGNDGTYSITHAKVNGANTEIYVDESIPSATFDGNGVASFQLRTCNGPQQYDRRTVTV